MSERTADADVVHIREFLEWHHNHRGRDCRVPSPCSCSSLPALDRLAALMAQPQVLVEGGRVWTRNVEPSR